MSGAVEAGTSRVACLVDSSELEMDYQEKIRWGRSQRPRVWECVPEIKHCICAEMAALYECLYVCCISLCIYMYVFKLMCVFHCTALRALMMHRLIRNKID